MGAMLVLGLVLAGCGAAAGPGTEGAQPAQPAQPAPSPPSPPSPQLAATAAVDEAREREAIGRVLDDFHAAAAAADEARYFGHFAREAVFLGTDATERWDVEAFRRYAHPHFARGKAWSFRAARRAITVVSGVPGVPGAPGGAVAWFDEDLETANLGPARGSGVLVREPGGAWKIAQYNLAITVPNERFDAVKRLLSGKAPPAGGN